MRKENKGDRDKGKVVMMGEILVVVVVVVVVEVEERNLI